MVKQARGVKSPPPESQTNARFDAAFHLSGGPKSAADCGFHVLVTTGQAR
jgi:hypothetical protein